MLEVVDDVECLGPAVFEVVGPVLVAFCHDFGWEIGGCVEGGFCKIEDMGRLDDGYFDELEVVVVIEELWDVMAVYLENFVLGE